MRDASALNSQRDVVYRQWTMTLPLEGVAGGADKRVCPW